MIESATQSPPPPPPPPPEEETNTTMISTCLSTIVTYPQLLQHEESLSTQAATAGSLGAYDVTKWITYLQLIDDVLDILKDGLHSLTTTNNQNKKKMDLSKTTTIQAGGTTFHISSSKAPGITHTPSQFNVEINKLVQARILVGERSVGLLPGSYKLWKNHLLFKTSLLESSSRGSNKKLITEEIQKKSNQLRFPPYLLTSSNRHNHYNSTKSAYERSLVRLHKMPSIWLHYAAFVALYNPQCDPTLVRHIYDRALIALPASQHERIWEDYLCWVTGILPTKSGQDKNKNKDWTNISRKGIHNVKYGFESPLVAQWRKNGWGYNQIQSMNYDKENNTNNNKDKKMMDYLSTVPTETALRILRRHANCFDTTFREDLATLCNHTV